MFSNTLDHSGRTHLSGVNARPRKINTSQPYLGSAERSPQDYIISTPGSEPIAYCTPVIVQQAGTSTTSYWMALAHNAELDVSQSFG